MYQNIPIIGIVGGIGSGKSYVADVFGDLGCLVIHSDLQVQAAYNDPSVRQALRSWLGEARIPEKGPVDKKAIAKVVFADPEALKRLESVLHPWVSREKYRVMQEAVAANPNLPAIVWDIPLLCEIGLNKQCDAVVFVDSDMSTRLKRVQERGWDEGELLKREKLQWALDKKREIAQYVVSNTANAEICSQVRETLSRILVKTQR